MVENFENIKKTFKILSKTLSKEYPYFSNIRLDSVSENIGQIYIYIDVNYNEFLEYNNIDLRDSLRNYFIRYSNSEDVDDIINGKTLYLSSYLGNLDRFGYKFNNQVEEYLNGMMEMLPEQLIPKYEFEGVFGETDNYTCNLKISEFILSFDLDRYIKYIN
jgi:hypothetical protein